MTDKDTQFKTVLVQAGVPTRDHRIFSPDVLMRMADGKKFIWDEKNQRLLYVGNLSEEDKAKMRQEGIL